MAKEIIHTDDAPKAVGPYVQAVKTGGVIYCSGQLGLKEAVSSYGKVIKTSIFLADMDDFAVVNEVYKSYFDGEFPARSCVQVAKLPLGGLVEIECIAEA